MATNSFKELDPVAGLVSYVEDIKPYHTKIIEVLTEYVYEEFADTTITDTLHQQIDMYFPAFDTTPTPDVCLGGYDTRPFGDGTAHAIVSPNLNIPFETYPAINAGTNSFIIPGDLTGTVDPGTKVFLISKLEDRTLAHDIIAVVAGPSNILNPPKFTVGGDQTTQFVPGYIFDVTGTVDNDGTYSVISSVLTSGDTVISVNESIVSSVAYGQAGAVSTIIAGNTGEFTVLTVEYSGGSLDQWPDVNNPSSYILGDSPHTIITVIEPLVAIGTIPANNSYIATMTISPIVIENVLSYSNFVILYTPLPMDFEQTPDEGHNQFDVIGVTPSTLTGGLPDPDSGKFVVAANLAVSNVFIGQTFNVINSSGNNGTYIISSISFDGIAEETTLGTDTLVAGSVVDGELVIDIGANVFVVDGDHTSRFVLGSLFDVIGGTYEEQYIVLNSDFVDGKTRIRVNRDIVGLGFGFDISGINVGFEVDGDVTSSFPAGGQFNVVGSSENDGPYVVDVAGSSYNGGSDITTIPVADTLDATVDGQLHPFVQGVITESPFGYSESSFICEDISGKPNNPLLVQALLIDELDIFGFTTDDTIPWFQYVATSYDVIGGNIKVNGDAVDDIVVGEQFRVVGSLANDQDYTISGIATYNSNTNITEIPVVETLTYGVNAITALPTTSSVEVVGTAYRFLSAGDNINIINSTGNNGSYTIASVTQNGLNSVLVIGSIFPSILADGEVEFLDRGGWVESL